LVLEADLAERISHKRISASEKLKWGLDELVFNASRGLNAGGAGGVLSHRRGEFGGAVPTVTSCRPFHRSCNGIGKAGASPIFDEGWSVVKPKFWWRKSLDSHGKLPLKQHREMKNTSFLRRN
jgi:hypothetical protein